MGFLARLFGSCGKVRCEGVLMDGRKFAVKVEVECFNASSSELEEKIKEMVYVETGECVRELHITGFVEC